ncbi:expressed unknown protein [Seminavis robusta]|uniref:Uncharacterized protein n=1 Tax=Seminavis robusta TaxID=568900 RepID=A0A9N8HGS7_9STRA|nr:expressed unknown protein [Seminavis robusta]|eukprot:Sro501_g155430.1 n/a (98) ;mRNA; r:20424-20717
MSNSSSSQCNPSSSRPGTETPSSIPLVDLAPQILCTGTTSYMNPPAQDRAQQMRGLQMLLGEVLDMLEDDEDDWLGVNMDDSAQEDPQDIIVMTLPQ